MSVWRRLVALNWLWAVLSGLYPPLRYIPMGALAAVLLIVSVLWTASHFGIEPPWSAPPDDIRPAPMKPRHKTAGSPGRVVEDMSLPDESGTSRSVYSLMTGSVNVLYLYSPYCGHCSKMLPSFALATVSMQHRGIPVIGIQWQGSADSVRETQKRSPVPGTLLADPGGRFCGSVGVGEFTVLVVDAERKVQYRSGGNDLNELEEFLRRYQ